MAPTLTLMGGLLTVDLLLIAACSLKFLDGAWFPLAVGVVVFVFMATWSRGSDLLLAHIKAETPAMRPFIAWLAAEELPRAGRTAIYAVSDVDTAPRSLLSNLKHNRVQVPGEGEESDF
jgi:KUP system potassium uptake protein